jgi:L-Ala-D/L-Glu epimerase
MLSLDVRRLELPLKVSFKHAAAERTTGDSVLVTVSDTHGNVGHGEGCPRVYVTNESWSTVKDFFARNNDEICALESVEDLIRYVEAHQKRIDDNPAAWCAAELALLDLFGKQKRVSIEALLGLSELTGTFMYTAVLGASDSKTFLSQTMRYRDLGFTDYKMKVLGDPKIDAEHLATLKKTVGGSARIRLDANNAYKTVEDAITSLKRLDGGFFAVEEPLPPNQYEALGEIAGALGVSMILDESLLRENQLPLLEKISHAWIINARVSKMGGLIRTLHLVRRAVERNIGIIVGAQVGETSILTRAALTVAHAFRENVIAQEGAFGELLLERDIVGSPIQFGPKGLLDTSAMRLGQVGLGIAVNSRS